MIIARFGGMKLAYSQQGRRSHQLNPRGGFLAAFGERKDLETAKKEGTLGLLC